MMRPMCITGFFILCFLHVQSKKVLPDSILKGFREYANRLKHENPEGHQNYIRNLASSNLTCDAVTDIAYGPSSLLSYLTDPSRYDKAKRPNMAYHVTRDASLEPDVVYSCYHVVDIVAVDQLTQTMTLSVYEEIGWADARLMFDPYATYTSCVPPLFLNFLPILPLGELDLEGEHRIVWWPEIVIWNLLSDATEMVFGVVLPNGEIRVFKQKEVKTQCDMHFGQYPFDAHKCKVESTTFSQSSSDISLMGGQKPFVVGQDTTDYFLELTQNYEVGDFFASKDTQNVESVAVFHSLVGKISLTRDAAYFGQNVLLPDLLLHLSIYCSFWIDAESAPARVAVCIITALSFRILMSSLAEKLPPVTYSIWVVDYMIGSQVLAVLSLVQYAVVAYFLSVQTVHSQLLISFKKSKLPQMIKSGRIKASTIFQQAEMKYQEFLVASKSAREVSRSLAMKQRKSSKEEQKKNHKSNLLEMIKIVEVDDEDEEDEEAELTEEDEIKLMDNNLSKIASSPPLDIEAAKKKIGRSSSDIPNLTTSLSIESDINAARDSDGGHNRAWGKSSSTVSSSSNANNANNRRASRKKPTNSSRSSRSTRSSSRDNSRDNSRDQAIVMLTTHEVVTIALVKETFERFDYDHNGVLTVYELKMCFRAFGKYYTTSQICALLDSYRSSQGSSLAEAPSLHIVDFFCLLVELEEHEPLPEFTTSDYFAIPPSHITDMAARITYPICVGLKIWLFFMILPNY